MVIFIWSAEFYLFFFFLDTADASLFAQAEFHNTMLSQEQEKTNVSAEAYCKSSWKGTLNSFGFLKS